MTARFPEVDAVLRGEARFAVVCGERDEVAVWSYSFAPDEVGAARVHETQKPLALMRRLVRLFSDPGEVICDPFAGSGTTGVAALMEGRRVVLVERDPVHAETCRRRLAETVPGEGTRRAKQLALGGIR